MALATGRLHVDEVLRELTAGEMREWEAFYRLEPFGDDWRRTALLAAVVANVNRDPDQRGEAYRVEEFMPCFEDEDDDPGAVDEDTWRGWKAIFRAMAEASEEQK